MVEPANVVGMKDNILGMRSALEAMRCSVCRNAIDQIIYLGWDPLTKKEYSQSGMCAGCQDTIFDDKSFVRTGCMCNNPCCEADVGVGIITCGTQHCPEHGLKDDAASS